MLWQRVALYTGTNDQDTLAELLCVNGFEQFEIIESEERIQQFLNEQQRSWEMADAKELASATGPCIRIYLPDSVSGESDLKRIKDVSEASGVVKEIRVDIMQEEDWANNWKQYYKPVEIGEKLLILPEWEQSEASGRHVLRIDPGMAFGTGTHETTAMCLQELEKRVFPGADMLDLGCGSGILAIASVLLGAGSAHGIDIDPLAVDISRKNAMKNGFARDKTIFECGDLLGDEVFRHSVNKRQYDIIAANIIADVIIILSPYIKPLLKKSGILIASGIYFGRRFDVCETLEHCGFEILEMNRMNDWIAIVCRA